MKKRAVQAGLAALEKSARHEGEKARQQEKNDDEDIGDRRGEIAAQFAFGDGLDVGEGIHFAASFAGVGQGDAAENFVQAALLGVQFLHLPAGGGGQDLAGQFAVVVRRLGINPRPDFALFLLDNGGPARVGHAGQPLHHLRARPPRAR